MQLFLGDFVAIEIIVSVPFVIERILSEADIVAEAESAIVINHAVQIISWFDL